MLAELDVVVFLKSNEDLEQVAGRVFGVLHSSYAATDPDETGTTYYVANGLGFQAMLFPNSGDMLDPEFETYQYGLEISSQYWDVELDTVDLEGPLSEYYARGLAFELDHETATEVLIDSTEASEIFEIRAYRRNPQYRLDQSPTTPKVFVIESRQVEQTFEDEDDEWVEENEDADEEETVGELEKEDR